MSLYDHKIFEHFDPEEIPQREDLFLVDQKYMEPWARCWADGRGQDSYGAVFVDYISVENVDAHSIELRWFINISTRFHAVQILLPRDKIIRSLGVHGYDAKVHLFVDSDWLAKLHSRLYAAFGMIDAIGVKEAFRKGEITKEKLAALTDRIDQIANAHPDIAFISFADSVLLKGNWSVKYVRKGELQSYQPELLIKVYKELSDAFFAVLGLKAYGIFTQGVTSFTKISSFIFPIRKITSA